MSCIVCRSATVETFLDLGPMALANKFVTAAELAAAAEPKFPLRIGYCHDCGHVQLTERVPPAAMFEDYLYVSSASDTLTQHLRSLAGAAAERIPLGPGDLVVDIGCNDGTLLDGFRRACPARTLGVDPAANLAPFARLNGIEVMTAFFNPETARRIRDDHGPVRVFAFTNTFPHIPDLHGFLDGIDLALAPDGVVVLEAHYLTDLLDMLAFDTIYHEHVSYWSLGPMQRLFQLHGFEIVAVERLAIHHGQLRAWIRRQGRARPDPGVAALLAMEERRGLRDIGTYRGFAQRILANKSNLRARLERIRRAGGRVAGYGAPAKGNTLLSFLELGPADIDYIADRNPLKQGRLTPGTHIEVVAPDRLLADRPDYLLILAWNFAEEIVAQQAEYRRRGGRFLVPVPDVREI
ncbi:MAG: class I SAM-dependent methyltransferase [Pseudomonadota bacterium]